HLLAGKILALGILGAIQIAVWVGAMLLLSQLTAGNAALAVIANFSLEPGQILVLALYFVLGYLFFAAAYGMVGAISTSLQEGPQYAVIFTLPAVLPLYFIALFTTTPNAPLVIFLSIFPITAPLAMVMRITITTVPFWEIALSAALLLVVDILLIWLAGRMFRVQTLLAGQAPKLRDIPRLLRG
ncbi:MAG: ABC transporter permease, partial [Anaerolineae bacterium]|nr:ABC transporter permease [Anaerolineae bacterium]